MPLPYEAEAGPVLDAERCSTREGTRIPGPTPHYILCRSDTTQRLPDYALSAGQQYYPQSPTSPVESTSQLERPVFQHQPTESWLLESESTRPGTPRYDMAASPTCSPSQRSTRKVLRRKQPGLKPETAAAQSEPPLQQGSQRTGSCSTSLPTQSSVERPKTSGQATTIYPELDRYRHVRSPPRRPDYAELLPRIITQHASPMSMYSPPSTLYSATSSQLSAPSTSPSTRGPGAYSRDTTPTSMSSQSSSMAASMQMSAQRIQQHDWAKTSPSTQISSRSRQVEADTLTCTSSSSTLGTADKKKRDQGQRKTRILPMPPSPSPRTTSSSLQWGENCSSIPVPERRQSASVPPLAPGISVSPALSDADLQGRTLGVETITTRTPSPGLFKSRFALFSRKVKTADGQAKTSRRGPVAGTGHEGYGHVGAVRRRNNGAASLVRGEVVEKPDANPERPAEEQARRSPRRLRRLSDSSDASEDVPTLALRRSMRRLQSGTQPPQRMPTPIITVRKPTSQSGLDPSLRSDDSAVDPQVHMGTRRKGSDASVLAPAKKLTGNARSPRKWTFFGPSQNALVAEDLDALQHTKPRLEPLPLPARPSRLPQVGRIPKVNSTRTERASPTKGLLQPCQDTSAETSVTSPGSQLPDGNHEEFCETTCSSWSGTYSYSDTTAIIPQSNSPLIEDEIWDEYNDLLSDVTAKTSPSPRDLAKKPLHLEICAKMGIYEVEEALHSPLLYDTLTQSMLGTEESTRAECRTADPSRRGSSHATRNKAAAHATRNKAAAHAVHRSNASSSSQSSDDNSTASHVNLRIGSMTVSKWLTFGHVLFSPARDDFTMPDATGWPLGHHSVMVVDGLGNDDWSYYASETYPAATFFNLSPREPSSPTDQPHSALAAPENHYQVFYPSHAHKAPCGPNSFSVVVYRFPVAAPEAHYANIMAEARRILRPGGFIELAVLDLDMVNMGPRCRRAVRGLKERMHATAPETWLGSASDAMVRLLGLEGFTNIKTCRVGVPVASSIARRAAAAAEGNRDTRSLAELMSEEGAGADEGITRTVAKVARWWYSRCYEASDAAAGTQAQSIWADRILLAECQEWATSLKLMVCHARVPDH